MASKESMKELNLVINYKVSCTIKVSEISLDQFNMDVAYEDEHNESFTLQSLKDKSTNTGTKGERKKSWMHLVSIIKARELFYGINEAYDESTCRDKVKQLVKLHKKIVGDISIQWKVFTKDACRVRFKLKEFKTAYRLKP